MSVSPNGRYLACFGEDGSLLVLTLSLEDVALRIQSTVEELPSKLVWIEDVRETAAEVPRVTPPLNVALRWRVCAGRCVLSVRERGVCVRHSCGPAVL